MRRIVLFLGLVLASIPSTGLAITKTYTFAGTSAPVCGDVACNKFTVRIQEVINTSVGGGDNKFLEVKKGPARKKAVDCSWPAGGTLKVDIDLGATASTDDKGDVVLECIYQTVTGDGQIVECRDVIIVPLTGQGDSPIHTPGLSFDDKSYTPVSKKNKAQDSNFHMDGEQEVPSNGSTATGSGSIVIDVLNNKLFYDITENVANENAAHIHGPAANGVNAGVLISLPAGSHKVGVWNYPQSVEEDLLNGMTYVNVHSTSFVAGEIRGQIEAYDLIDQAPGAPPWAMALAALGLALGGVGVVLRQRTARGSGSAARAISR